MTYFTTKDDGKKKTSRLLAECKALFSVWSYYSDAQLDKDFPPPKKPTTRYFRKVVETDEQYANVSAEEADKQGIKGITLRERILLELTYFKETGEHLDVENTTLCTGSRNAGGFVPDASRGGDEFRVCWHGPAGASPSLRLREAVDPSPSTLEPLSDLEIRVKSLEEWKEKITRGFLDISNYETTL